MSHMFNNDYFSAVTVLLTKEFKQTLLSATDNRDCYSFLVVDIKMSGDINHLFYVPIQQIESLHSTMDSILTSGSVSTTLAEIPWSTKYSPMFLSSAIADRLGINLDEHFTTPACRIDHSDDRNEPALYAVMFGKKKEWPYQSPIINLFVSFVDYINKQKKALSSTRINTLDIDRTVTDACDYSSIIRAACERELIYRFTGISLKQSSQRESYFDLARESYFDLVCNLACMTYEGGANKGYMRFTAEHINTNAAIHFKNSIACTIKNRRELRKLLEMTDGNTGLLVTKGSAIGLAKGKNYRSFIQFGGSGKWKLYLNDTTHPIMSVEGNVCRFCLNETSEDIHTIFQSVFGDRGNPTTIKAVVEAAKRQKHGTSIIISECAEEESHRLAAYSRAIPISPIQLDDATGGIIESLTAIDGALLLSLSGECFAIGAILDGEACSTGTTARGARYNSLANYVKWKALSTSAHPHGIRSIAVVISEDQTIDFITPHDGN